MPFCICLNVRTCSFSCLHFSLSSLLKWQVPDYHIKTVHAYKRSLIALWWEVQTELGPSTTRSFFSLFCITYLGVCWHLSGQLFSRSWKTKPWEIPGSHLAHEELSQRKEQCSMDLQSGNLLNKIYLGLQSYLPVHSSCVSSFRDRRKQDGQAESQLIW